MINIDRDTEWQPMMNKIMAKLKDLEDEIGLVKSDLKFMIKEFDKVIKNVKKVK